jgi:2-polyprenyl-3-methyl-5-hydroxy-6-metoxy-1,4-benzoquinol methylase
MTDNGASHYDLLWRTIGLTETQQHIIRQVAAGSMVLELGPASGYMTREFASRSCVVDAVELNPADARLASRYCRTLVVGSLEDPAVFEQLRGPYDIAVIADVIEHLRDPMPVLRRVAAQLKPGGLAFVSLPNIAHWRMRISLLRGRFEYTDTGLLDRTHLRFYTWKTAHELFTAGGFDVLKVVIPQSPRVRFRTVRDMLRRRIPTLFSLHLIFHLRARG